jgi:hypothetical protein
VIESGLAATTDPETKGMLEINKALTVHSAGDAGEAVRLLRELAADPTATFATEALAKAMLARITRE